MSTQLSPELQAELITKASRRCWQDVFEEPDNDGGVYDYCGGNVDDAYDGGMRTGEILFARELCAALGLAFEVAPR